MTDQIKQMMDNSFEYISLECATVAAEKAQARANKLGETIFVCVDVGCFYYVTAENVIENEKPIAQFEPQHHETIQETTVGEGRRAWLD